MKFPLAQSVDHCQDRYSTSLPAGAIARLAPIRAVANRNVLSRVAASTRRIGRFATDRLAATIPLSRATRATGLAFPQPARALGPSIAMQPSDR